ncbi:MAG: RNA polymerase sigma factor [Vicinamibacteria bacterium]|jgi:RNA polymerase sigma-70 factor (ECF subfamily)|nr:RNA polymerase sigma factor [Vicinamibacteria bacterium]
MASQASASKKATPSGDERDEKALIDKARQGDAQAIEALLARHQPSLYRFGLKMCRNPEDAQDILQDTLLASLKHLKRFRGESSLSTWLYTIARSFCIKKRRRRVGEPATLHSLDSESAAAADTIPDRARTPDEELQRTRLNAALDQAVAALAPGYREVLVLRDMEGLPAAEVARILGLKVEAVKSRLHRARAAIRRALAPLVNPALAAPVTQPRGCPNIVPIFSQYIEGEIGARVCTDMQRHLKACPHCQSACDSLRKTLDLCQASPRAAVPRETQEAIKRDIRKFVAEHQ